MRKPKLNLKKYHIKSLLLALIIPVILFFMLLNVYFSNMLTRKQIEENTYKNINDTVTQTKTYLDYRLTTVFNQLIALENNPYLLFLMKNPEIVKNNKLSLSNAYIRIRELIEQQYNASFDILDSIYINMNNGKSVFYQRSNVFNNITFDFSKWRRQYPIDTLHYANNYIWAYHPKAPIFADSQMDEPVVSIFRLLGTENSHSSGIILYHIKEKFFKDILTNVNLTDNGYFALINENSILSFKDTPEDYIMDDEVLSYIRKDTYKKGSFVFEKYNGKEVKVIYDTLAINKWKIAAVIPQSELTSTFNHIKVFNYLALGLLIIIAIIIINIVVALITKPLLKLTNKLELVTNGNLDVTFTVGHYNELSKLNTGITNLMSRIRYLLKEIAQEKEREKEIELAILQAQINPHFLYNTLYSIQQLYDIDEKKDASKMLLSLSRFYRLGLSKGKNIITIKEEIIHANNYLIIQQIKYADRLTYTIDVDSRINDCSIIKLTLQPLVENAIYHGIQHSRKSGIITITGEVQERKVLITIKDNGCGMDEKHLKKLLENIHSHSLEQAKSCFGLRNVHQRIQTYFGKNYGISITSTIDEGTEVTVTIPFSKGE